MARESFTRMMSKLKDEVLVLSSMVEDAVQQAIYSLLRHDPSAAHQVCRNDQVINEKRFALENAVLIQIATQQPMAHDLRSLAAILEIINELERMGDYAKGIAKVTLLLQDSWIAIPSVEITEMTRLGTTMLHRGIAAFVEDDVMTARKVAMEDDAIDEIYNRIYQKVVNSMILDPSTIDQANYLMWVAHNLERLGDRVVNICERTIFTCTGELFELDVEREDEAIS